METMVDREELLEQRVGSLEGKVDDGFKQVGARFDRVEGDVREVRGDIKRLDERLTGKIEAQGKELRSRFDRLTIGLVLAVVGTSLIDHLL